MQVEVERILSAALDRCETCDEPNAAYTQGVLECAGLMLGSHVYEQTGEGIGVMEAIELAGDLVSKVENRQFDDVDITQCAKAFMRESGLETQNDSNEVVKEKVQKALRHVNSLYPEVNQVFFGTDQRWLFCGEGFETPKFGKEVDVSLLEEAADSLIELPAAFYLREEAEASAA